MMATGFKIKDPIVIFVAVLLVVLLLYLLGVLRV